MKFKLKDKITNTGDWQIINKDLIYVSKDELKSYNQKKTILNLTEYWGIEFYSQLFNVVTKEGRNTIYNYFGDILKDVNRIRYYHIFSENDFIWYDRQSKKTKRNEIEVFNDRIGNLLIRDEYLFFDKKTSIYNVNINNGKLNWQFPLSQFGKYVTDWGEESDYELQQFIGVYKNILWCSFNNFGGLIGLDVETGELKHRLKVSDIFIGSTKIKSIKEGKVPFYNTFNLNLLDTGKIIGLAIDIYYEVDLNSTNPKVTAYGLDDEYQKFGIDKEDISRNSVLQETLLYFYNHNQHTFGILNTETKKIIYISDKIEVPDTQDAWGQLKDLKASGDKVYVLDSTRTLHIFEKESTENNIT